jgi:uncharacterized protein YjiS (DUF1127 family)
MNALIHSFDRLEPSRPANNPPGLLRRAIASLAVSLREARQRRAMVALSEFDDHLLRDIGLTVEDVRGRDVRPLSDGRWLIDNARIHER